MFNDFVNAPLRFLLCVTAFHHRLRVKPKHQYHVRCDRYRQQAFRLGDSYGLQFHLELTADEFERWLIQDAEELVELYEKNLDELRAQVPKLRAAEGENRELLERLAHHFARVARAAR